MTEGERYEYFSAHPPEGMDPRYAEIVARQSARVVPKVVQRDDEQAARRRPRAS